MVRGLPLITLPSGVHKLLLNSNILTCPEFIPLTSLYKELAATILPLLDNAKPNPNSSPEIPIILLLPKGNQV